MPRKPAGTRTIVFEAALPPAGNCFTLNSDGEARFTIVVSAAAAKPLAEAMAKQVLNNTAFAVAVTYPDPEADSSSSSP